MQLMQPMKTTLKKILEYDPCIPGLEKGRIWLNAQGMDENTEVTPMQILEAIGIKDAVWALRAFAYKDYCLFLADIAEGVYPVYKKKYPNDYAVWGAIQAIHAYKAGIYSEHQLKQAAYVAHAAAYATTYAAAAHAAYATTYAAYADAYSAAYAYADITIQNRWDEIEQLFIRHFEE